MSALVLFQVNGYPLTMRFPFLSTVCFNTKVLAFFMQARFKVGIDHRHCLYHRNPRSLLLEVHLSNTARGFGEAL